MSLVPRVLTVAIAAKIAGQSPERVRDLIKRGTLDVMSMSVAGHPSVLTASLERYIGREITPELYLAAERARDPARQYQRDYNQRSRKATGGDERRTA